MSLNEDITNARMSPVSDPQAHRPTPVAQQGLPHQERVRLKRLAQSMRIGTINVGTMTGRGRAIADLMRKRKVEVMCVQETRWTGNKAKELGDGYKLIYGSANKEKRNGIGIILSEDLKSRVVEVNRKSDRILWIRMALEEFDLNVFSVYAPQSGCDEEEKDYFWSSLQEEFEKVQEEERCVIGGDLNGHVGRGFNVISRIHGGMCYGDRNEDGERVIDYAISNDMAISNTMFTKRQEHLITYKSGGRASQIDYLLYRRRNMAEITNCKVIPGDHVTNQHRLVVMDLKIKVTRVQRPQKPGPKKIKWHKLNDQNTREEFKNRVTNHIRNEIDDLNYWWNEVAEIVTREGKDILGETSGKIWKDKETWWFDEEIQRAAAEKKQAKKKWEESREERDKEEYKIKNKATKKAVAIVKNRAYDQLYEGLDSKKGQGKIFQLAKARNRSTKDIIHIKQMKDENGNIIRTERDNIKRWRQYFSNLLNEENERQIREDGDANQGTVLEISRMEVKQALEKMKNGKATGPDGVPIEVWKAMGEDGVDVLWTLMRKVMREERIPETWRESFLIPIFKEKGDVQSCENYRGIKLMSHTLKLLERILDGRIRQEAHIGRQQLGFMKGVGTVDGIFCLRQTMEKYRERRRVLHMMFIDLEKAYDRVPRQEVWRCMRKRGVPEKYVRIIQETYKDVNTRVRCTVGTTDAFEVKVGLHQGSALSPILFNVVMDVITEDVRDEPPRCILYADDIVLVAETRRELQRKMDRWKIALESRGLKISRKKTEYFTTDTEGDEQETIEIDGYNLKRVNHFKYLGAMVEEDGSMKREIAHRIQCGWNNWRKVSGVICDKRVPVKLKGKIHKSVVRPAMMYGLEAAPLKRQEERKLDVAEMKMLRWMVGITRLDQVRNDYVRGSVKVGELSSKVQESRLRWFGHLARRGVEHVGKSTMEMEIDGVRPRGRPKTRWKDVIQRDMREKELDEAEALNRNRWKRLIQNGDPV